MTQWERKPSPKMKYLISKLAKSFDDDDDKTEAQQISSSMCELAQELYLCESLDEELDDLPELAKYKKSGNKKERRIAFIFSLITTALNDIGADIIKADEILTTHNQLKD